MVKMQMLLLKTLAFFPKFIVNRLPKIYYYLSQNSKKVTLNDLNYLINNVINDFCRQILHIFFVSQSDILYKMI